MVDDETDVDVLDDVGILNENSGQSLVEDAWSEIETSWDDEVLVGAEDNDCGVVEVVDTDVSKEVDIVVDSETVSKVGVDVGEFPTGDSPVAGLTLSEACPEIADSSS